MTAKPNILIAQSGGPTAVINAGICGVIQTAQKSPKLGNIYGAVNGIRGVLQEEIIDLTDLNPAALEALKQTPAAALGSSRYQLKSLDQSAADCQRIIEVFQAHDIHYFFCAGGNDSMDTADKISQLAAQSNYQLTCIGIPKTVDNDLAYTDHCPGYGSTAKYVATAAAEAGLDNQALCTTDTCTILEVMGRNAGWIAAAAGLAAQTPHDAPHLIYLPETPFTFEKLIADVKQVHRQLGRVFIVVGEGLKDADGNYLTADTGAFAQDHFGHLQLGGIADLLKTVIEKEVGVKTRCNKPGTNQRSAIHCASLTDLNESYLCGAMAVQYALDGAHGKMVSLLRQSSQPYQCTTTLVELSAVAHGEKKLPPEFINNTQNHITDAFKDYLRPLLRGRAPITINADGLPAFTRLNKKRLPQKCPEYKI